MPQWAQWLGELFPITHALRIIRGLLLKRNTLIDIVPDLWPIVVFTLCGAAFVIWRHRSNIARLRAGTEHRLNLKGARP